MIQKFWREETEIKIIFIIDFFLYLCTFLIVPIISLYLKQIINLNSTQIGTIIGLPSVVCCLFSTLAYYSFIKLGSVKSILLSIIIDILLNLILLVQVDFYLLLFGYFLKGIAGSICTPIFKNLYLIFLKNPKNKNIIFKIRYILICTSAIIAPFISKKIYPISNKLVFLLVIFFNFFSLVGIYIFREKINSLELEHKNKINLKLFLKEKSFFLFFLLGTIVILTVFSQFEGTFILTLKENALNIFSDLLILNSILGIIFQIFQIKYLKKLSSYKALLLGSIFFSIAYFSFVIFNENLLNYSISITLFTIGETLVLPNIETFISEISTTKDRVLLYSLLEFRRIGFFLGPFLSGIIIQKFSVQIMFLFFSILGILGFILFILFHLKLKTEVSKNL